MKKWTMALCPILVLAGCPTDIAPSFSIREGIVIINEGESASPFADILADGNDAETSMEKLFTVKNDGTDPLAISVALDSGDTSDFDITTTPSSPLEADGLSLFGVTFDPLTGGDKTAVVRVSSDAGDMTFTVTGHGLVWMAMSLVPGASTRTDVVASMGREPDQYCQGSTIYTVETLPAYYMMVYNYPSYARISFTMANPVIQEIRIEGTRNARCHGTLACGLTPAEVFSILEVTPATISNQPEPGVFAVDTFYENMDSIAGRHYYDNSTHGIRMFWASNLTTAVYIYAGGNTPEILR